MDWGRRDNKAGRYLHGMDTQGPVKTTPCVWASRAWGRSQAEKANVGQYLAVNTEQRLAAGLHRPAGVGASAVDFWSLRVPLPNRSFGMSH